MGGEGKRKKHSLKVMAPALLHPLLPPPWPSPHCTLPENGSESHRRLLGCSFDKTSTEQGLGPSIPQRSTVGHTLYPLPLEKNRHVRKGLGTPRKPSEPFMAASALTPLPHRSHPSGSSFPYSSPRSPRPPVLIPRKPSLSPQSLRGRLYLMSSLSSGGPRSSLVQFREWW